MEAKELRIGNYINYLGTVNIVESIAGTEESYVATKSSGIMPVNAFQPIILTEGWLLKFGFKYREFLNDFFIKLDDHNILIAEKEVIGFAIYKCEENQRKYFLTKKYYAHQLQNLFFALTGEELTQQ